MEYGGEHPDAGTEMSQVSFPDGSYIEVLGPTDTDPTMWPDFFDRADPLAGPTAWCVETGSVHAECKRLIEHDVTVHGPNRGRRRRPDGTVVEWDAAFLGRPDEHLFPFLIADRTPRERRVPESELYGSPVSGIGVVILAVDDLNAAVDRFQRLYRLPSPEGITDRTFGDMARFPGQDLILAEPADGPVHDRVTTYGPSPASVLLRADIDEAAHQLPLNGSRDWDGRRVRFLEGFDFHLGLISRK